MESAVIIYHKNALNYCQHRWLIKCLDTIENQTYKNFDIFEVSYGNTEDECSIIKHFNKLNNHKLFYFHQPMKDHSYAMNFLLNKVFAKDTTYKYCFNINIDDFYDLSRFERQVQIIKKLNYDAVSSNMIYVDKNNNKIKDINYLAYTFVSPKKIALQTQIQKEQEYIKNEFSKNHNIVAHPCVCYTRRLWELAGPYENKVPVEDLLFFKKISDDKRLKIHIMKKPLLYYRIHTNQTVATHKMEEKHKPHK